MGDDPDHQNDEHDQSVTPQPCPRCGAAPAAVVEDVSDEVTVYGCSACDTTWAQRRSTLW